jgi:hypothetical protein
MNRAAASLRAEIVANEESQEKVADAMQKQRSGGLIHLEPDVQRPRIARASAP